MRVLLSSTGPAFSEVLESTFRSAGLDLDDTLKAEGPRASRGAAARLQQLPEREREFPSSTLSDPLEPYLANQDTSRPSHVARPADPRSVAEELHITPQMTLSDLKRLRREFARANHPDRVGSAERETATCRMMLANMLIDREMKRRQMSIRTPRN